MSSTRFLCIGDPHFRVENILEVEEFIIKLIPLIKERKPDFIVVLGDLLHTHERLHTIALNKACEFINELRKHAKTFVIVGNHDYIQNQQFLTDNHWMNGLKEWENVVIVDRVIQYGGFVFSPYVPPGRFEEALNTLEYDWRNARCIFAHQEFFGCKMGAIVSVDGDKWDESFPFVVSGHIHSKQRPQANIYYTGSAMQHAFGESEENIIAVIDFSEGGKEIDEVDLELKRKKIVYMDMGQLETFKLEGKQEEDVKISLSGNYDEFKAFKKGDVYKRLVEDGVKVVFKINKKEEREKKEERSKISHEGDFKDILREVSLLTNDKEVLRLYELLVNNNDVMIL
jgi:DNA repair exonuclease SbcCD nuclease subunit